MDATINPVITLLLGLGYKHVCTIDGRMCALGTMAYTTGLYVGLDGDDYERRYCYENRSEALAALLAWNGCGDPGGPWLKVKGTRYGVAVDHLNPELKS